MMILRQIITRMYVCAFPVHGNVQRVYRRANLHDENQSITDRSKARVNAREHIRGIQKSSSAALKMPTDLKAKSSPTDQLAHLGDKGWGRGTSKQRTVTQ